jgi:type IV secretory pathway VirJ component
MTKSVLLILPLLAACVSEDASYPSLAERPAEKRGFAEPEAPPPAEVAADPALDARVAELRRTLMTIAAGFDRDVASAEAAAGRAGARTVGGDAWLDAQTAVAGLDDWRAQAAELATDVEQLAGERAARLAPPYPALDMLGQDAAAQVERLDVRIRAVAARLPSA